MIGANLQARRGREGYAGVYHGDDNWRGMRIPEGDRFVWNEDSTYAQRPPYFDGVGCDPAPVREVSCQRS